MKTRLSIHSTIVLILLFTLLAYPLSAQAAAPYGVDHLRGRWDGVIQELFGVDQPFVLMLNEFGNDPNDSEAFLYNGCIAVGVNAGFAPISARVLPLGSESFNLTLYGTAASSIIKMTGVVFTGDPQVHDDPASGAWQTSEERGDWSAFHHDRREPNCPALTLGDRLHFSGDAYSVVSLDGASTASAETILEGFTNVVSSGMRVTLPNGNSVDAPFFTDLFSPSVNLIDSFRFLTSFAGLPLSHGKYSFTLLDVFSHPIAGATVTDVWIACLQDAPRNVSASADSGRILVTWDPVPPVTGFDPNGIPALGFYQIELSPLSGDGNYGAAGIHANSHLIPFAGFGGFATGFPDGEDFGNSLSELMDGVYAFDTIAFSQAVHSGGFGLECQIRALDEQMQFEKSGATITILL